jgi:hypothetical protein
MRGPEILRPPFLLTPGVTSARCLDHRLWELLAIVPVRPPEIIQQLIVLLL